MKHFYWILLFCSMGYLPQASAAIWEIGKGEHCATCNANGNCRACKTCNYCKHCNAGGSCSVCSGSNTKNTLPEKKSLKRVTLASATCQGLTKKGARCKRMVKDEDYCWQHRK